jgi:hypothetical protein
MFRNGHGVPVATRTQMRSDTLALMEKLDGGGRRAYFHQFLHQVVRHAVVAGVENDVVINVDPCAGPLAEIETLRRQGIQRRLVENRELRCPRTFSFAERSLVDTVAQFADGLVQFRD